MLWFCFVSLSYIRIDSGKKKGREWELTVKNGIIMLTRVLAISGPGLRTPLSYHPDLYLRLSGPVSCNKSYWQNLKGANGRACHSCCKYTEAVREQPGQGVHVSNASTRGAEAGRFLEASLVCKAKVPSWSKLHSETLLLKIQSNERVEEKYKREKENPHKSSLLGSYTKKRCKQAGQKRHEILSI